VNVFPVGAAEQSSGIFNANEHGRSGTNKLFELDSCPMYERVDFLDGTFLMVCLPLARHALISAYRQELRSNLEGIGYWVPSMDSTLFATWGIYYTQISKLMEPAFDAAAMTPDSRHRFFICSTPVERNGEMFVGLPQLDLLLGMGYPEPVTVDRPNQNKGIVHITSGDPARDLLADLLIMFKDQALPLSDRYSFDYLNKLVLQTAQRKDPELQKKLQAEADKKRFEQLNAGAAVREHYRRMNIVVPDDF
jgi:hypothetical protein